MPKTKRKPTAKQIEAQKKKRLVAARKAAREAAKLQPKPELTPKQLEAQKKKRSEAARKAALALWAKRADRPPSKVELKRQEAKIPTSELTIEHYADRPNPELSWAAAILKRRNSGKLQRREAARIFSHAGGKRESPWSKLPPKERSEIARRGGVRRWEIWREEQARLQGKDNSSNSG